MSEVPLSTSDGLDAFRREITAFFDALIAKAHAEVQAASAGGMVPAAVADLIWQDKASRLEALFDLFEAAAGSTMRDQLRDGLAPLRAMLERTLSERRRPH